MVRYGAALLLSFCLATGGALADEAEPGALARSLVTAGSPGAGVGIADGGEDPVCAVAGARSLGEPVAVAPDDLWHVGSVTKPMTATLAARLVTQGRIGWDTTVGQSLGDRVPDMHPAVRDITLEQLLSHRSGLPENVGPFVSLRLILGQGRTDPAEQRQTYVAAVLDDPPDTLPGAAYRYSNAGYTVAGAMLEAATGLSWEELMRDEVFGPLGLSSAGFGPPGTAGALDQPLGHRDRLIGGLDPVEPGRFADNPLAMGPAATVHLSICDLARFAAAHAAMPTDYLPAEAWETLHRPRGDGYALGWIVHETGRLQHAGSNRYWLARVVVWPRRQAAAMVVNDGRLDLMLAEFERVTEALAP